MHLVRPRRFLRRVSIFGTLAALVALTSVSLTQCRMVNVGDSASGMGFENVSTAQCITNCNKTANDAIRAESDLHVRNVRNCNSDPICLDNEEARHEAAVNSIQAARNACVEGCHHQGGGAGGR
jgi:hypothetical protein